MSNEIKLEQLTDVLTINQDKLKATEAKAVIKKIKQLMKVDKIEDKEASEKAEELPYEGVSIVGSNLVTLRFDLETKEARVTKVEQDSRDTKGKTHMARFHAEKMIVKYTKEQK